MRNTPLRARREARAGERAGRTVERGHARFYYRLLWDSGWLRSRDTIETVRLQDIHAYNLIRALRVVIPFIVAVLIAIPAWNYVSSRAARPAVPEPPPGLGEDVQEVTEDIQYTQREAGQTVFTVDADRNRGMADGRNLLEDVVITIAGQDASSPDRLIESDNCAVDGANGSIRCTGNIEIQSGFGSDNDTVIRTTDDIVYDTETQAIATLGSAEIVSPGVFEADAGRLSLRLVDNVLEVSGGVNLTTAAGTTLSVDAARYYQAANRIELLGGVRLRSGHAEVRSALSEVALVPDTLDPSQVSFYGDVSATSSEAENRMTVAADSVHVDLVGGSVKQVTAEGAPRLESSEGARRRLLQGDAVVGSFSDDEELQAIESSGNGLMLFGDGQQLQSDYIRNEIASSTVRSGARSILEVGEFRVEGSDFVIRQEELIRFTSARPAVIGFPSGSLSAPNTTAAFDPESGVLTELLQTGGAEFDRDGLAGTADRIEFGDDGWFDLTGAARVTDAEMWLDADRILLQQDEGRFRAEGAVRAVLSDESNPVLIEGQRAEGDPAAITFYSSPELWRGNMHVAASNSIEIRVEARRFLGSGDIASTLGGFRVWADSVDFDDAPNRLLYTGSVRSQFPNAELDADELEVYLARNELDRVLARGGVEVRSDGTVGRGDRATYEQRSGTVTLVGTAATVAGSEMGTATGTSFVWNVESNRVVMTGDDRNRAVSRRTVKSP